MEKKKLGYLSSLDLLRGLAAVAVCYFHFTHGNPDFLSKTNILYQSGRYGFLGVDVFFVISGFVIPYAMYRGMYRFKNFGTFLLKRVIRIEPPFLISIILVIALNWLSTYLHITVEPVLPLTTPLWRCIWVISTLFSNIHGLTMFTGLWPSNFNITLSLRSFFRC